MVAVPDALQTFGKGVVPVLMWIISLMVLVVVILLLHVTPLRRHASDDTSLSWPLRAVYTGGPYIISSLMAGLLGIVLLGQLGAAIPGGGTVIQIEVLLAVVIGGTPFGQGYGYAIGGVAGVLIASLLNTLMNLVQTQSGNPPVFWRGLLLVVGMLLAHLYAFGVQWLFGRRAAAPAPES